MDPQERKRREDLLATMDDRRSSADNFAWAVPAVIVASQASLVPFALDPENSPGRRAFAVSAALVLTLAAYHFFRKQMFAIQLFEEVGMRQREALELFQVDRDSLLTDAKSFTADFQDAWMVKRDGELVPWRKGAFEPKRLMQQRVTDVWIRANRSCLAGMPCSSCGRFGTSLTAGSDTTFTPTRPRSRPHRGAIRSLSSRRKRSAHRGLRPIVFECQNARRSLGSQSSTD